MFELNKKNVSVDCSAMKQRHVELEVSGRKTVLDVAPGVTNEQLQEALDYMHSMLVQSCYIEYTIADCFLIIAKEVFKKKKVFKFAVKKHFAECQNALHETMNTYELHINDGYYNEYSCTLYDMVAQKIEKLRKIIENKLRGLDCKYNPYLCSYAIMIQNLVQTSDDTFTNVVDTTERLYGCNMRQCFKDYRAGMAYTQADNLVYDVMHDEAKILKNNIVQNKDIIALWSNITQTIYDLRNVRKARLAAFYNMPEEEQALYNLREDGFCEPKEGATKWKKGA